MDLIDPIKFQNLRYENDTSNEHLKMKQIVGDEWFYEYMLSLWISIVKCGPHDACSQNGWDVLPPIKSYANAWMWIPWEKIP
jgi:hypothetical protein